VLYYRYEEEKDQDPETPQLARSRRALSSRWSDEEPQEGSEQEGMPWKGARMKVGDLVCMPQTIEPATGIVLQTKSDGIHRGTSHTRVKVYWIEGVAISWEPVKWLEVLNESR